MLSPFFAYTVPVYLDFVFENNCKINALYVILKIPTL